MQLKPRQLVDIEVLTSVMALDCQYGNTPLKFYCISKGRQKEILITAGGENIAPVPIEDAVKADIPAVSNAVLIGDHRKYLSMILTLRSVVDVDTDLPTNRLAPITIEWCRSQGSQAETIEEIVRGTDEQVRLLTLNFTFAFIERFLQKYRMFPVPVSM